MTGSAEACADCPSDDQLVRMVERALAAESLAAIEAHVDTCAHCAAVVANLGALATPGAADRRATAPRAALGRYELDRRIAAGGMGEVWAAWDPELRRDVAVKLVRPERADDGRERERLLREARALARLAHPNVLAVYDVGEVDGEVFLATELVAGDTLANRGGPTADWRALAGLYVQAARGLAAAHAAGLVHRDIKPANLLVGGDGRVRVADFGLAVRAATPQSLADGSADPGSPAVTATGRIAGTPAYMAPEQRAGQPADARADQFALCLALVEAIDGRRPPVPIDAEALVAFVGERRAHEPALVALCGVLARGLARDRDARHPDMATLGDAIERALGPVAPAGRPRARKLAIAVAAITTLATLVALVAWRATRGRADEPARVATTSPSPTGLPATLAPASPATSAPAAAAPSAPAAATSAPAAATSAPAAAATLASPAASTPAPAAAATLASPAAPARASTSAPVPRRDATTAAPRERRDTTTAAPNERPSRPPPDPFAAAEVALHNRDARACAAVIAALPATPRGRAARAMCEMVTGDCDAGVATLTVDMPLASARALADMYCPPGDDPIVRQRRLAVQVTRRLAFDCDHYLPIARAVARDARAEIDRIAAASILVRIAQCYGDAGRCDDARAVAREARALNPALAETPDVGSKCR